MMVEKYQAILSSDMNPRIILGESSSLEDARKFMPKLQRHGLFSHYAAEVWIQESSHVWRKHILRHYGLVSREPTNQWFMIVRN